MKISRTPNGRNVGPRDRSIPLVEYRSWAERTRQLRVAFGARPFTAEHALVANVFDQRQWSPLDLEAIELRSNVGCPYAGRMLVATTDLGWFRVLTRLEVDRPREADRDLNLEGRAERMAQALLQQFELGENVTTNIAVRRGVDSYDVRAGLDRPTAFGRFLSKVSDLPPPTDDDSPFVVRLGRSSRNSQTTAFSVVTWSFIGHVAAHELDRLVGA